MRIRNLLWGALLLGACVPSFEDRPWLVDEPRILAVTITPAEARPGELVTFGALAVDVDGPRPDPVGWNYCARPRTAGERTGVTERCARGESLEAVSNPGTLLPDACARFGPNTPPTEGDAPAQRPADPDPSGGYYLPIRADVGDDNGGTLAFGFARVRCDLVGVTRAIFDDFEARYTANLNPIIHDVLYDDETFTTAPTAAAAGSVGTLSVALAIDSFEDYVVYIAADGAIEPRAETLTVRWYVTGGELSVGEAFASPVSREASQVEWTAPDNAGSVAGWVVVADDRGGLAWRDFTIAVQ